jgi:general secretion pathway protein E
MRLPYEFARAEQVLLRDGQVRFTSASQVSALAEAQRLARAHVSFQKVSASVFAQELEQLYRDSSTEAAGAAEKASDAESLEALADSAAAVDDLLGQREDAPVVRLINALLLEAIRARASDVHIELEETELVVRFRVDGELRLALTTNRALAPQLVSRIKVMGRLDIAEKRLPQDGRVSLRVDSYHLDARISTIPSQYGERVVMRLLDRGNAHIGVSGLWMPDDMRQRFEGLLIRPDGLILVTGPTGSGKTTTLYAGLGALDCRNLNVMTIEDPIEYALPGIAQMQVNPATDLTFARGLRALLRQDPNVIMVGEIRDTETARIAVEAATTGHLVMSTLHTNTAIGSVARLLDLGVERFLLAPVLRGLMAQRLVRKTCSHCVRPRKATGAEQDLLQGRLSDSDAVHEGQGCDACGQTGFLGRIALYDLIEVGPRMEEAIASGASERALLQMTEGAASGLLADGAQKVRAGLTTPREVARVFTELEGPVA